MTKSTGDIMALETSRNEAFHRSCVKGKSPALYLWTMGILLLLSCSSSMAQWQPQGALAIPKHDYTFLSTTPGGDLLAAAFNRKKASQQPVELPVFIISNPSSSSPEWKVLLKKRFDSERGYSGIACDEEGNCYISGDTGERSSSFVIKLKPDGSPASEFGKKGELHPKRRCLGVDVAGNHLLLAVDWGEIQVRNINTGKLMGNTPSNGKEAEYVRDIALDPTSMNIYGVAEGGVIIWEGGYPWQPQNYRRRRLSPKAGPRLSCEGICYDPVGRSALIIPLPRDALVCIDSSGKVKRIPLSGALHAGHAIDPALSMDGTNLYLSFLEDQTIHHFQRTLGKPETSVPATPTRTPIALVHTKTETIQIGQTRWYRSYKGILTDARKSPIPMIIYFRKTSDPRCLQLERTILSGDAFNQRAKNFLCIYEDISRERFLSDWFGVGEEAPHLEIIDKGGDHVATVKSEVYLSVLLKVMDFAAK